MPFNCCLCRDILTKLTLSLGLLALSHLSLGEPVTFEATGDWETETAINIDPTYVVTITFDNGGTSAKDQVFDRASFLSLTVTHGSRTDYFGPSMIVYPTWWAEDFVSNSDGVLTEGYVLLETQRSGAHLKFNELRFFLRAGTFEPYDTYGRAYPVIFAEQGSQPANYTIGGSLLGLTGSGLELQNNGGDDLQVAALATDFSFSTPLEDGADYAVAISSQPSGQTCSVTGGDNDDGSGTVSGADVTSVIVTCADNPPENYIVSATVSGGNGSVECIPSSVSPGENSTCTATPDSGFDVSGWTGDCASSGTSDTCLLNNIFADQSSTVSFTSLPQTPAEMISSLADQVLDLNLKRGISNALDTKLESALAILEDANQKNDVAAINKLYAFIAHVDAQSGKSIEESEANALIAAAEAIIQALSA